MKLVTATVILGAALACAVSAAAPKAMAAKPKSADITWLKSADTAGNAEVAEADIALTKAQRPDVRAFAQKMHDDHLAANKEVAAIAVKLGILLPAKAPSTGRLDKAATDKFDADYVKAQVKAHEEAKELFEKGAKSANSDIRDFATKTLPTIEEHLAEAKKLQTEITK